VKPPPCDLALAALDRLPPFSPLLTRLVSSLANDDVSFSHLAGLIEKDAILAGNVLRVVNSALYGCRGTVNSVPHAVAILGLNKLRNFALGLSVSKMWSKVRTPPEWPAGRFNLHSVATAMLADLIGQEMDSEYPEGAFVAGLLHDLGKLLIAVALPAEFTSVAGMVASGAGAWAECESTLLGTSHAELSGLALERWGLPEPICRAAAGHHQVSGDPQPPLPLGHVVGFADQIAVSLGYTILEVEPAPASPPAAWAARLIERFQPEFESVRVLL